MPVPKAEDLAALNRQLLAGCQDDEHRTISGSTQSVGAALIVDENISCRSRRKGWTSLT